MNECELAVAYVRACSSCIVPFVSYWCVGTFVCVCSHLCISITRH